MIINSLKTIIIIHFNITEYVLVRAAMPAKLLEKTEITGENYEVFKT